MHVGAAEAVDGLLRVADGDQCPRAEGRVEDIPLQSVGVLELVDEHDGKALGELCRDDGASAGVGERALQSGHEVVVADLAAGALSPVDGLVRALDDVGPPRSRLVVAVLGNVARAGVREHRLNRFDQIFLHLFGRAQPL